jgi:hypothetical protein
MAGSAYFRPRTLAPKTTAPAAISVCDGLRLAAGGSPFAQNIGLLAWLGLQDVLPDGYM